MLKIKKVDFLLLLLVYLSISSLFIALLYAFSKATVDFLLFKDYAIYVILLLSLPLFFRQYKLAFVKFLLPVAFILVYSFLGSGAPLYAKLASVRQILTPFVLFFLGYIYVRNEQDWARLIRFQVLTLLVILLFGFFERFTYLWYLIDIKTMFAAKNIPVYLSGYPPIFIFPNSIIREADLPGMVRMVSSFLDPINLGHTLVFGFCVLVYENTLAMWGSIRKPLALLFAVGVVLTISKGAILQLFLVVFIFNSRIKLPFRIMLFLVAMPFLYFFVTGSRNFSVHYGGLYSSLFNINLLGHGLAVVGNYSRMFASDSMLDIGIGDSFWGSLIGQIGIIGFLFWLYPFWMIIKISPPNHYIKRLLFAQLLISALSENAFNLLSVAFLMVAAGAYSSTLRRKERHRAMPEETV